MTSGISSKTTRLPGHHAIAAPAQTDIDRAAQVTWFGVTLRRASRPTTGRNKFWNAGLSW